ncbi:hypothetical protein T4B_15176 [Trichinella pseudospiralis]|uniref:Uncharacterized protein n=1 Tax=Trichinella pseudospiralis TaxID=6337 RepID=A0A0V1E118_TRIPS|nr:hypothetical protein T4A_9739 [Trichinella pseudospiralis]KRZ21415.1 hypothetical protein T4B_15176 [Trichinella pseudospiralis]KRZ36391.1 hypothetical protein T4C_770 [Trichinella pseudospiralis]
MLTLQITYSSSLFQSGYCMVQLLHQITPTSESRTSPYCHTLRLSAVIVAGLFWIVDFELSAVFRYVQYVPMNFRGKQLQ